MCEVCFIINEIDYFMIDDDKIPMAHEFAIF